MSYDLAFWAYENESAAHDHHAVYRRLCDGERNDGLQEIPARLILARFATTFRNEGWTTPDEGRTWQCGPSGDEIAFQIDMASQGFVATCYGLKGEHLNLVIDIGLAFGLRLYDPQVNERFAGLTAAAPARATAGVGRLLSRFRGSTGRPN